MLPMVGVPETMRKGLRRIGIYFGGPKALSMSVGM